MRLQGREIKAPTDALVSQAKTAAREFARLLQYDTPTISIYPDDEKHGGAKITLSRELFELIVDMLGHLALGNGVAVLPVHAELTTQQAADILNVSRPFFIRLLEEKKIAFTKVGTHRRVRLTDLLAYMRKDNEERQRAMDELTALSQEDGFEY